MQRAAIYARYSDDEQRATSIDDQIRRARQKAEQSGFTVDDEHVFVDAAITGQDKGLKKRVGYERFIAAWEEGVFDAIVIDEISRLARSTMEFAYLQQRIERTRVRLVSCDGIDTSLPSWELHFGMSGLIASHFVRETSHRVQRGMQGQLIRGFMIAKAAYGYRAARVGDRDNEGGTIWEVDEDAAQWVRQMFAMRYAGASFNGIAENLNRAGVPCPRPPKDGAGYWRPATVRQVIGNTIYRGVFVYRGSAFTKAKAKREKKEVESIEYARPELRIVDDSIWYACNTSSGSKAFRGGAVRLFTGLVTCGVCRSRMSIAGGGSSPGLYCAACAQRRRVASSDSPERVDYVSVRSLEHALTHLLNAMFDNSRLQVFRDKLRARLTGGHEERIIELRLEVARADRQLENLAQRMRRLEADGDDFLDQAYRDQRNEKRRLVEELAQLEAYAGSLDRVSLEKQLAVNPLEIIPALFRPGTGVEQARAVLSRVFPTIMLSARPRRFVSVWNVEVCEGAVMSSLSGTSQVIASETKYIVCVETSAARPAPWHVTVKEASPEGGE
ncbi:recombinase family protein [Paraburkholderia adhaesiva]|uniref:recombinase family protein n=1 Tax=Paraburkholderia adhaesiva TaxID=2883244 RepID=UPI001F37D79F|nr:recombinase family protein [Paraburkholderia adhaesiva]